MRPDDRAPQGGSRARLRRAIAAYARGHPHASDTLPGILHWWIPRELQPTPDDVQAALDDLVDDGILRRTRLVDGTELFSVPPAPDEAANTDTDVPSTDRDE